MSQHIHRWLSLLLLPFSAISTAACTLVNPAPTINSYIVNPQRERIAMHWQNTQGKAWGSINALLAGINGDGRVQMAMNGGIYSKAYAPLGLYIENGQQRTPLNRASGGGNFFIRPGGVFYVSNQRAGITPIEKFRPYEKYPLRRAVRANAD